MFLFRLISGSGIDANLIMIMSVFKQMLMIAILKEMTILTVGSLRIHAVQRSEPGVGDSQSDMAFDGNADWYEVYPL